MIIFSALNILPLYSRHSTLLKQTEFILPHINVSTLCSDSEWARMMTIISRRFWICTSPKVKIRASMKEFVIVVISTPDFQGLGILPDPGE